MWLKEGVLMEGLPRISSKTNQREKRRVFLSGDQVQSWRTNRVSTSPGRAKIVSESKGVERASMGVGMGVEGEARGLQNRMLRKESSVKQGGDLEQVLALT